MVLTPGKNRLDVTYPNGWLYSNPLTYADLQQEMKYLKTAGFKLTIS